MIEDRNKVHQALVGMVIEKALMDMGQATYDQIVKSLWEKYQCYLTDCYGHPEYLHKALKELYGNVGNVVIESIKKDLEEWKEHKQIGMFLKVISR